MNKLIILFSSQIITILINFFISVAVARYLGADLRGEYAFIMLFVNLIPTIANFGSLSALPYVLRNDGFHYKDVESKTIKISLLFSFLSSCIVSIIYILRAQDTVGNFDENYVFIILWLCFFFSLKIWFQKIFVSLGLFKNFGWISVFGSVMVLFSVLTVIYFDWSLIGLLTAQVIINFLLFLIYLTRSWKVANFEKPKSKITTNGYYKAIFDFSKKSFVGDLANRVSLRLDQIFISVLLAANDLGIYVIAVVLCELLFTFMNSIGMVLFREIANEKSMHAKRSITERSSRIIFSFSILVALIFGSLCYYLIPILYGEEFNFSKFVLLAYLPGVVFYNICSIISKFNGASGLVIYNTYTQVLTLIIGLPVIFWLTKNYQIIGAAIGSTLMFSFSSLIAMFFYFHLKKEISNIFFCNKTDMVFVTSSIKQYFKFKLN
tara:strand:- start:2250 stop:3557 length:1308 start_codon:yes stop_codon:yes gene_type:complete